MTTTTTSGVRQEGANPLVRLTQRLEQYSTLDAVARWGRPATDALLRDPARRDALQGKWLGHAVHPMLTDLPLGLWTSTSVLDLVGGRRARPAAQVLLAAGIAAAVPTAVTGAAEWGNTHHEESRVGLVHAAANAVGIALYTGSLLARRRGHHHGGVLLAIGGGLAGAVGGYLGAHLTAVRKVSSRHPAFMGSNDQTETLT